MIDALFSMSFRAAMLLAVMAAAGDCYVSKFTLGPADKATVDALYCGDWQTADGKDHLIISNLNNRLYLVQETGQDNKPTAFASFIVDVKGAHIAHNGVLTTDGKPPEAWVLKRVEIKDNQLVVRDLNKAYFESKNPASADELRKLLEDHINDDEIYDGSGVVLTRTPE
jgi:hypothetical protein